MNETSPLPSHPQKTKRVEYIDLLRGWAVIVMIETHMMNATVTPEINQSLPFVWLTFINGLVAPSFMFASGLAWAITTRRKLNDYLSFGPPLFKQVRRLLFVVFIGYLLHVPKFNYNQILHETTERMWQLFFQADVLQCIGVSLLLMQLLLLLLKSERRMYYTMMVLAGIVVFISPIVWGIDWLDHVPMPVAGYMNGLQFNIFPGFPLFPWSAFLFAGAVFGYFYMEAKESGKNAGSTCNESKMMAHVLWLAAVLMLFSALIEPFAADAYPAFDYGPSSPSFFLLRLGIVMVLCSVMFFCERWKSVSPKSWVTLVGRESLIVYSIHLLLIYGNFATFNFFKTVNHTFGYGEAMLGTLVLLGLMIALSTGWDKVRTMDPRVKQYIQGGVAAFLVLLFFFGPGQ